MKTIRSLFLITLIFPVSALAQGSLTPPGGPAETMKTLSQVEPRTDLATVAGSATAMHVITEPGSYYLSGNLDVTTTNGIEIRSSGVTIDLMGFTIHRASAAPAFGTAILIPVIGLSNITIRNGHITGSVVYDSGAVGDQFIGAGFADGISISVFPYPTNVRVSRISVSGCDSDGIALGSEVSNSVDHCSVRVVGGSGINAGEVEHCVAIDCGFGAIYAGGNVLFCYGKSVGTAFDGIYASGNVAYSCGVTTGTSTSAEGIHASRNVTGSYGLSAGDDGIHALNITNSDGYTSGTHSGADGIYAVFNATNSSGYSHGDDGIDAGGAISYSRGCTLGTGVGIECTIGIGCNAVGGESITHKYLMP